jgi:hypothetical protein
MEHLDLVVRWDSNTPKASSKVGLDCGNNHRQSKPLRDDDWRLQQGRKQALGLNRNPLPSVVMQTALALLARTISSIRSHHSHTTRPNVLNMSPINWRSRRAAR